MDAVDGTEAPEGHSCTICGSISKPHMAEVEGRGSDGRKVPTGMRVGTCPECGGATIWDKSRQVHPPRRSPLGPYKIPKDRVKDGVQLCGVKVAHLLQDAEILCHSGGHEATAIFLYTVALEEFGKALLLRDLLGKELADSTVRVPGGYFAGPSAHRRKIDVARRHLPPECIQFTAFDVVGGDGGGATATSIAEECSAAMRQIESSSGRVLSSGGLPKEYSIEQNSHIMAAEGDQEGCVPGTRTLGQVRYDERARYSRMYIDWSDRDKYWNVRDTIGPLRITVCDNDTAFGVEVERGGQVGYPRELIEAIHAFRKHLGESDIWEQSTPSDGARDRGLKAGS